MQQKNVTILVFEVPVWIDGFPYSKEALRRKKEIASFPVMVDNIDKWENDLKDIFREKYSIEYIRKLRNSVKTIKVGGRYVREDYVSNLINYVGGRRVTCNQPDNYEKVLHIYGACVVTGTFIEDAETLPSIIQSLFNDKGSSKIRVENHGIPGDTGMLMLKHNIIIDSVDYNQNDIVIILDNWNNIKPLLEKAGQKVLDISNYWPICDVTTSQFFQNPLHMGPHGVRLLAEIVYDLFDDKKNEYKIVLEKPDKFPLNMTKYSMENIKSVPKNQISRDVERFAADILNKYPTSDCTQSCGAIVMNANPFTYGHRHLVEFAASKVDRLYVFCVEEDRSFFSFEERLEMIKAGTSDLRNVVVVPSGKYIISYETFPEYFVKDSVENDKVDVTKDIKIFCEAVAPALGITKRFVGEEPKDSVTKRYNQGMKEILPLYNIDFEEIPRLEVPGIGFVSASAVRQYIKDGDYEKLRLCVPKTTFIRILQGSTNMQE
jgi:[citrate (pro-3S)-lyase] ligase